jgi:hypothetical protein
MSYVDIVICIRPLPILETWPPIYRGQERTVRDRLKASQVYSTFTFDTHIVWLIYRRVHPTPYSPDPKSFILDICRVSPRQLGTQETSCTLIVGLLERDTFDLFLHEFDKPWVIHLRENCCCFTNLCTWRPNTVYKNRSNHRHQALFWRRCRGLKKKKLPRQSRAIKLFSGAVAGEVR